MSGIGRNEKCHCGSGRKYKVCCLKKDREGRLADIAAAHSYNERAAEFVNEHSLADVLAMRVPVGEGASDATGRA